MTTEESALQVDWRSTFQETNTLTDQPTSRALSPDPQTASNIEPETSVMGLSAVLVIILGGIATTFAAAAIILFLGTHG